MDSVKFDLKIPFEKSAREDGWYIRGVAAGPGIDNDPKTGPMRLRDEAFPRMVARLNEANVPFKDWHARNTILSEELGRVEHAEIIEGGYMVVDVKLDEDHPTSQYLWKALGKGKQFGMSIGGEILPSDLHMVYEKALGRSVADVSDVHIDEISIATKPIYAPSLGTVIRKAIDEALAESVDTGDTSPMPEETPQAGTETPPQADSTQPADEGNTTVDTTETQVTTTSAPETVVGEETTPVVVEKAVNADTKRDVQKLSKLVKMHEEMGTLISDLGLKIAGGPETETTPATTTETAVPTVIEHASTEDDEATRIQKAVEEATAGLRAEFAQQLEAIRDTIPGTKVPPLRVSKGLDEDAQAAYDKLSISDKLRLHLAASHGELDQYGR